MHGYQSNAESWTCQQNALCNCYPTLSFDLRGSGRSSTGIDYTMNLFADDLKALLYELGISNNIILIGESLGSGINFAARYPDNLQKLVLTFGAPVGGTADCGVTPFCSCLSCSGVCYPLHHQIASK